MKILRETLTIVAGLLVLALVAALAVPYFVDWTAQRARIEDRLAQTTGLRLKTNGRIDLRLLPSPRLVMSDVKLADAGPSSVSVETITAEIAPAALLRGHVQFTELALDKPAITVALDAEGKPIWPRLAAGSGGQIGFESLSISQGQISILRPDGSRASIEQVSAELAAPALTGPWRADGAFVQAGGSYSFQANTGVAEDGRARIKFSLAPTADASGRAEFDGAITPAGASLLEGQLRLSGSMPIATFLKRQTLPAVAYELSGNTSIDARQIRMDALDLRLGTEERGLKARGSARLDLASGASLVALEAQRIDLDTIVSGRNAQAAASSREVPDLLQSMLEYRGLLPDLRLSLKTPVLLFAGEPISDVSLALSRAEDHMASIKVAAGLPGRSAIELDGRLEMGAAARYAGRLAFESRDYDRLRQWLDAVAARPFLPTLPFAQLALAGEAEISATGIFARALDITADRSRFQGHISATQAVGTERARFTADLLSPALDLDQIPDLTPLIAGSGAVDFSIALDARAIRLARVGQGMVDAGRINLKMRRNGPDVDIERLDIAGLGGASLSGSAQANAAGLQGVFKLDAERLVEFAQLLQRVVPGVWSEALARRAVALSPAALTISARADMRNGMLQPVALRLEGSARGTKVAASLQAGEAGGEVTGRVTLANAQTPALLRQLGFEVLPLDRLPDARIDIEARGQAGQPLDVKASAMLAGVSLTWGGRVQSLLPSADLRGPLVISSKDASPLLQILALALPDATARAAVELAGEFSAQNGRFEFASLSGSALGSRLSGALAYSASAADGRMTGDLAFDRLSLEGLASLVLGPRPPARGQGIWPDFRFAPAPSDPPPLAIGVQAERLALPNGSEGERARFTFEMASGYAAISQLSMALGAGAVGGRIALRRDRASAAVNGELTYEGPLAAAYARAGRVTAALDFAGSGQSYAAIVASLAGRGRAEAEEVAIPAADPGALSRLMSATLDMADFTEMKVASLLNTELARGPLALGSARFELSLAGGQVSLRQTAPEPLLTGALDLRRMSLDAALRLTAAAPEGWSAAAPEALVRVQGSLAEPRRSLSLSSLINGLGARAIEREAARIELLEFEARERAAYLRRQRAAEFLEQRAREIAAYHAEEERRIAEEQRRAAEEQRAAQRRAAEALEREKREREKPARPAGPAQGAPLQLVPPSSGSAPGTLNDPASRGRY